VPGQFLISSWDTFICGRNASLVTGCQFRFLKIGISSGLLEEMMTWPGIDYIGIFFSFSTPWRRVGWVEVQLHSFLTSALEGGEWSALHLGPCTFGKAFRFPSNMRLRGPHSRSGRFCYKMLLAVYLQLCFEKNDVKNNT